MADAAVLSSGGLETVADQALFAVQYDAVAAQMADRYSLKIHYNLPALEAAYRSWIKACAAAEGNRDHRHFITAVGLLIESLARHNIVTYSVMTRPPGSRERQLRAILTYPHEVTALLVGAAVYAVEVERLTGEDPTIPLSGLVLENAAAILHRRPEAAAHFRELLQLSTPWM